MLLYVIICYYKERQMIYLYETKIVNNPKRKTSKNPKVQLGERRKEKIEPTTGANGCRPHIF